MDENYKNARNLNIPISGTILQMKAVNLAQGLGLDFHSSEGWLSRFKQRHDIQFRVISGESGDVTTEQMDYWSTTTLPKLLIDYHPRDIFNADELGLFYKFLPAKSLVMKGDLSHGGKRHKDRIFILPCVNMDGMEKMPLLVIGKSMKPRCFKGVKTLPTPYQSNKNAWMTANIFTEWVRECDRKFSIQNRQVAIVIDNCPAHPHVLGL